MHEKGNDALSGPVPDSDFPFSFTPSRAPSEFRGALELNTDSVDKKGKKRESRVADDSWNPIKWFPKEAKPALEFGETNGNEQGNRSATIETGGMSVSSPKKAVQDSVPQSPTDRIKSPKWGRLRSLLPTIIHHGSNAPIPAQDSAITSPSVNITDELITGGLSTLMLRLWFERDEKGHRRIPILFHRLRIRVSDSLHPMQKRMSIFRIECEYANGAARWVVYRRLRDFISLHTHYTISNAYNRNVHNLPEFPRTSM